MSEKRKNDCYWLGKEDACMNRETHPDHTYHPQTLGVIPLEPVCDKAPGCGYMPKPKRRARQRCRWYDFCEGFCLKPQLVTKRDNCIINVSILCQRTCADWEERKEADP